MSSIDRERAVLDLLTNPQVTDAQGWSSSKAIGDITGFPSSSLHRILTSLHDQGLIERVGRAKATRYRLRHQSAAGMTVASSDQQSPIPWSADALNLLDALRRPLSAREPTTYQRAFVEEYTPNHSSLLPAGLAQSLFDAGKMSGQQPAGTYARKVLEQLMIELSWSSSRLEGNTYSLIDTKRLFETGAAQRDAEAVMLLNHKDAIQFMVDDVPRMGLTTNVVRNLHSMLMDNLLDDVSALGAIRNRVVYISGTNYVPSQVPHVLAEVLEEIVAKARLINNPVEAAFFLWINVAYLQPFEDGNKRTSPIVANIPLLLHNCAPLAFMDVDVHDYAQAMIGVYERNDLSIAIDLFAWTYERSIKRYGVVMQATALPDPHRAAFRDALHLSVDAIVRRHVGINEALSEAGIEPAAYEKVRALLVEELNALEAYNASRYRLSIPVVEAWIAAGRPAAP